jgi:hypothetical protein
MQDGAHCRSLVRGWPQLAPQGGSSPENGGKETLGGLNRWFIPRGQDLAFLLSYIGLLGLLGLEQH